MFVQKFLEMIRGNQVFGQFAQVRTIPRGTAGFPGQSGITQLKSVEFTGYEPLDIFDDTDDLAGGSTETNSQEITTIRTRTVNTDIELYSKFISVSELLAATSLDREVMGRTEQLGDLASRSLDWLYQKLILDAAVSANLAADGGPVADPNLDPKIISPDGQTTLAALGGGKDNGSTNITAAAENSVAASNTSASFYDLAFLRKTKAILEADRAPHFDGMTYGAIIPYAVEERFLAEEGFLEAAKYNQMDEIFMGEMNQVFGIRMVKTTEPGIVIGVDENATVTRGQDSDESLSSGAFTIGAGQFLKPRQSISEFAGGAPNTDTYWQADTGASTFVNSTGPLVPTYFFGRDSWGRLELQGENVELIENQGPDSGNPAQLFRTLAFKFAIARVILQARWMRVGLGAVEGQILSDYFTG